MSTRISDDEFHKLTNEVEESTDWQVGVDTENIKVWTKNTDNFANIKLSAILPFPLEEFFEMMLDVTLRNDTNKVLSSEVIEKFSDHEEIVHTKGKSANSWIVTARDFCNARRWTKLPHGYMIVERFCEHAKAPLDDNFIRAKMLKQVVKLTKADNQSTKYEAVSAMDLGGWIPQWVISLGISKAPEQMIEDLKVVHDKYKAKKGAK